MNYDLNPGQRKLLDRLEEVCWDHIAPNAEEIDSKGLFPTENLRHLGEIGLLGLLVPQEYGGLGHKALTYAAVVEEIAASCASTALVFAMHSAATAAIVSRANRDQAERYLRPIARGECLATIAFSEAGSGSYFWAPSTQAVPADGGYQIRGKKTFVTSAGFADLYVVNTRTDSAKGPTDATFFVVPKEAEGLRAAGQWNGMGLRGNHSSLLEFQDVFVAVDQRLGVEGDAFRTMREVILPLGQVGISAVNLGIARAAYDAAVDHVRKRSFSHLKDEQGLASFQVVQHQIADMRVGLLRMHCLMERTARLIESGSRNLDDIADILSLKVAACEVVHDTVSRAMRLCGGAAFAGRHPAGRYLRDAQAGAVMAPTVEVLKDFIGKAVFGIPVEL